MKNVLFKVYNYIKQILDDEYLDINVINTDTVKSTTKIPNKKSKKRIIYVS